MIVENDEGGGGSRAVCLNNVKENRQFGTGGLPFGLPIVTLICIYICIFNYFCICISIY